MPIENAAVAAAAGQPEKYAVARGSSVLGVEAGPRWGIVEDEEYKRMLKGWVEDLRLLWGHKNKEAYVA